MLVMIDGDDGGLAGRHRALNDRCLAVLGQPRGPEDRLAALVPCRSIETWAVHLLVPEARPVDEAARLKEAEAWRTLNQDLSSTLREAVNRWDPEPDREDPPSLVAARSELKRLA